MWMLFVIILQQNSYMVAPQGPFVTMKECFKAREYVMQTAPEPKINYEAVCIRTDQVEGI